MRKVIFGCCILLFSIFIYLCSAFIYFKLDNNILGELLLNSVFFIYSVMILTLFTFLILSRYKVKSKFIITIFAFSIFFLTFVLAMCNLKFFEKINGILIYVGILSTAFIPYFVKYKKKVNADILINNDIS